MDLTAFVPRPDRCPQLRVLRQRSPKVVRYAPNRTFCVLHVSERMDSSRTGSEEAPRQTLHAAETTENYNATSII
jgi:hypothetical protein